MEAQLAAEVKARDEFISHRQAAYLKAVEDAKAATKPHSGKYEFCAPHMGWEGVMWTCCNDETEGSTNCKPKFIESPSAKAPCAGCKMEIASSKVRCIPCTKALEAQYKK